MPSTTVRINIETLEALRDLAGQTGEPIQKIMARAVEAYRRRYILEEANTAYAALRSDPEAWQQVQQEWLEWDGTLADGLDKW